MEDIEKKIEEYALKLSGLKPRFDRQEEEYYQSEKVKIYDLVRQVIKSPEAKEYWQQGMYSEEQIIELFDKHTPYSNTKNNELAIISRKELYEFLKK